MTTMSPEHAARRRMGIGGSDAAAVLGLSAWASPLHVYLNKKGEWEQKDNSAMASGRILEHWIATAYEEQTGRPVNIPVQQVRQHAVHEWMLASLDREAEDEGEEIIVELKAVGHDSDEWGEPGTDEVPPKYLIQGMHQLAVTGWKRCDIAAMFWPGELRVYQIHPNEAFIEKMIAIEADFWNLVKLDLQPAPDWSHPQTASLIKDCQRIQEKKELLLTWDETERAQRYVELGKLITELKAERETVQAQLVHALADAQIGLLPGGGKIKCNTVHNKGYTVDPFSFMTMHVKLPKG